MLQLSPTLLRAEHLLKPKNWPLAVYLDHCDCLLTKDLDPRILTAMPQRLRARVSKLSADWIPDAVIADGMRVCIMIDADALNPDALANVTLARALAQKMGEAFVFGTSEFMPGAYREFIRRAGADDCVSKYHVLNALSGEARP